ncbi:unnamed protein product [Hydatigera taeniaeformis]|uniref:Uncharacterized protein n=1 Tax=Hydatigena taeniaeformis TaxID=6205 RepID=A0A0R3WWW7_HYDTA|nr:unnamed protein product [Hydatigera taeniaeformis]
MFHRALKTCVPPAVYARYYFDLLTVGEAVALPATNGGERRRMTPRLARRLRVLPASVEARAEFLAAAASGGIAFGGGGILFDLPCSSLTDATSVFDAQPQQNHQNGCSRQRLRSRQRPHSASPPLSSTQVRLVIYSGFIKTCWCLNQYFFIGNQLSRRR